MTEITLSWDIIIFNFTVIYLFHPKRKLPFLLFFQDNFGWAIPRKIQTRGVEDIEFLGRVTEEWHSLNPRGQLKKVEFPGVIKKKSCKISMCVSFWPLKFPKGCNTNFRNFLGAKLCLELWSGISKGKVTDLKIPVFFPKSVSSTSTLPPRIFLE